MSDIPTDLPEPTSPPQRCAVNTRVSMDNALDDKLSSVQEPRSQETRATVRRQP